MPASAPAARARSSPPGAAARCGPHGAVRTALTRLTSDDHLAGASVLATGPCGRWTETAGTADLRTGRPMNSSDRLRVGSVTKTFTATVVLQLAAEHRLSPDATVDHYLPGLIDAHGYDGRRLTVRQLLRHTSGLPDATGDPRTVYAGAQAVHRDWPGSRLVTLRGADRHAVFGVYGSDCADATVDAYLATGRLPATDVSCAVRPVPAP